jgi:phenylpropionate dioxygenase-like ring-hydroxylating dioxygenase large terminal subunit
VSAVSRNGIADSSIASLLADMDESLAAGLVPARIFNDPELHELELRRVFGRAWLFVGHESEIPHRGDYCLRYLGRDPFIFVRDEAGQVRVLFDGCRHRGTLVCRAERGNASHFRCSYHGWTYKNTGELVGMPKAREAYRGLDKSEWGLIPAPQVESVHGLVFASLDADAPPLDEYLGDMRWYLDMMFGLGAGGIEVVGEPQRYVVDANWKSGAENFAADDYHTLFLHKSMYDIGAIAVGSDANMTGYHVQAGNGHTLSFSVAPPGEDPGPPFWGYPEDVVANFDTRALSDDQRELARRSRVTLGAVFPNFAWIIVPQSDDPSRGQPDTTFMLRLWQPAAAGKMECWVWYLVWRDMNDDQKARSYQAGVGTVSSSGIFEQDDVDPWASIARTGGSVFARQANLKLNYQMGLPHVGTARVAAEWPGPGLAYWPRYEEGVQRALFGRWLEYMTSDARPPAHPAGNGNA